MQDCIVSEPARGTDESSSFVKEHVQGSEWDIVARGSIGEQPGKDQKRLRAETTSESCNERRL
jgi:hypothetical protein